MVENLSDGKWVVRKPYWGPGTRNAPVDQKAKTELKATLKVDVPVPFLLFPASQQGPRSNNKALAAVSPSAGPASIGPSPPANTVCSSSWVEGEAPAQSGHSTQVWRRRGWDPEPAAATGRCQLACHNLGKPVGRNPNVCRCPATQGPLAAHASLSPAAPGPWRRQTEERASWRGAWPRSPSKLQAEQGPLSSASTTGLAGRCHRPKGALGNRPGERSAPGGARNPPTTAGCRRPWCPRAPQQPATFRSLRCEYQLPGSGRHRAAARSAQSMVLTKPGIARWPRL